MNAQRLPSENVVIAAPMSLAGSAARIWKITGASRRPVAHLGLDALAALLILCAWTMVLAWYLCFGLLLVPYRLVRRGQRQRKRQALQHRETLGL